MEIINKKAQEIMLIVLKDLATIHTATSLSAELRMSRWGVWKILRELKSEELINLDPVGKGKTSIHRIDINWDNVLVEKLLVLFLSQEALKHKRWIFNFVKLEKKVDFLILFGSVLYSSKQANDIDIISAVREKNIGNIWKIVLDIQKTQTKKIHSVNFTKQELKKEIKDSNKTIIDAVKKGIVLFGHENFVKFMREMGHG